MKVVTVVGARPQFVKASMLSRALQSHVEEVMIHTGQHYDSNMSDVFFSQLKINEPKYMLNTGSDSHGAQTAKMLVEIERILQLELPDWVLVYGDTNSTLAGSLAAAKLHRRVAHVEAGLRSFNRAMPEELNRLLTDHLSSLLFCPTDTAVENLANEGIRSGVHQVGDIMCDALLHFQQQTIHKANELVPVLSHSGSSYAVVTIHRAENTDNPGRLHDILLALRESKYPIVMPLHPRTRKTIQKQGLEALMNCDTITVLDPLPYFEMLMLTSQAKLVLTDSGGLQKEAYMLKVPCVTLREQTEWPETVLAGWNSLVGSDKAAILKAIHATNKPLSWPSLYGTGSTAEAIVKILMETGS